MGGVHGLAEEGGGERAARGHGGGGVRVRGGNIGELGVFGKCKQPGDVLEKVYAIFTGEIGEPCHYFHGHSLSSSPSWWLLLRCLFHHLLRLPFLRSPTLSGTHKLLYSLSIIYIFLPFFFILSIIYFP